MTQGIINMVKRKTYEIKSNKYCLAGLNFLSETFVLTAQYLVFLFALIGVFCMSNEEFRNSIFTGQVLSVKGRMATLIVLAVFMAAFLLLKMLMNMMNNRFIGSLKKFGIIASEVIMATIITLLFFEKMFVIIEKMLSILSMLYLFYNLCHFVSLNKEIIHYDQTSYQ